MLAPGERELRRAIKRYEDASRGRAEAAKRAHEEGMTVKRIAEMLGFRTRKAVYDLWAKFGLTLLVLLTLAPSASAIDTARRIETFRPIAEQTFPQAMANCGGSIEIVTGGLSDPSVQAEAWPAWAGSGCQVRLRADWPSRWDRSGLCAVLVHEYGHLSGLEHSDDPKSVMYTEVVVNAVPACREYARIETAIIRGEMAIDTAKTELVYTGRELRQARNAARWHRARRIVADRRVLRTSLLRERARIARLELRLGP